MTTCGQEVWMELWREADRHGGGQGAMELSAIPALRARRKPGEPGLSSVHATGHPREGFVLLQPLEAQMHQSRLELKGSEAPAGFRIS